MNKFFSQGSLQEPQAQEDLYGHELTGPEGTLHGYERGYFKVNGEMYPCLSPNANSFIEGTVYELTDEELAATDKYETNAYKRVEMTIELLRGTVRAWVYVSNS